MCPVQNYLPLVLGLENYLSIQEYLINREEWVSVCFRAQSCVKIEVAVLGSPSLIVRTVCVDVKQHCIFVYRAQSCVKVEVAVLGSPSLIVRTVCVDVKQHCIFVYRAQSCVKVEVAVLGSPSLIVRTVCVDVKQHWTKVCVSAMNDVALDPLSLLISFFQALDRKTT